MTCFIKRNWFNSNENEILNDSTGVAKQLKQKKNDSNNDKNNNKNNNLANLEMINVNNEVNKSQTNN